MPEAAAGHAGALLREAARLLPAPGVNNLTRTRASPELPWHLPCLDF